MLISICIPQYNRSEYLLAVLDSIRVQSYPHIEVIISDDCSTDDTFEIIPRYISEHEGSSHVMFRYIRQKKNLGYDGNLRASLSAAQGDYLFILGNDDALSQIHTLSNLAGTLEKLEFPDVAFANFHPYGKEDQVVFRAQKTALIGFGTEVAAKTFRSFSFVAGIILKRSAFHEHNTDAYDGSIYVQIYLAARIISAGGSLASIKESMVAKDVRVNSEPAKSYLAVLETNNRKLTHKTGGLDQVGKVACDAILPYASIAERREYILSIYHQILIYTYPVWLFEYRRNGVYRAAVNLALGCFPSRLIEVSGLSLFVNIRLYFYYAVSSVSGLFLPVTVLKKLAAFFYRFSKRVKLNNAQPV